MTNLYGKIVHPDYRWSYVRAVALLVMSLIINFYAGQYATREASNSVTDLVLSNTRVYDLDGFFIYGSWLFVLFIAYVCFRRPHRIPFLLKSISLFVLIRALFISLTHIGPFLNHLPLNPASLLNYFVFGGDLFFSGHTGLPFLLALIFWKDPLLRYTFLATSFAFACIVLLAHLHYSIDVLSAYFISFGIYHLALFFFSRDYALFKATEEN